MIDANEGIGAAKNVDAEVLGQGALTWSFEHFAGSQAEPKHNLEGLHPSSDGRNGRYRFFTVEVLTWRGIVTFYILFFIHLESRRVCLAGITRRPDQAWMEQMARNATAESWGYLDQRRYALHDRDTKFCASYRKTLESGGIKPIQLPARSPNLNAYAERWVRSVKEECVSKLILFGEDALRRALTEFTDHFHSERNHQGKGNVLLFPGKSTTQRSAGDRVRCKERLGGLLRFYTRAA